MNSDESGNTNGKDGPQTQTETPKTSPQDIFVIAWDGCLVSTTQRNIEWGLAAACQVWPELELLIEGADLTWLYNKLHALQHVLAPFEHQYHPAVEYGLAIRMLLEEQELDLGKSNGSKGKYGSKFHPSKECQAFPKRTREINTKKRQQRPLTVGEISTNWRETLREAAWIRYAQEEERGVNPLDLLQECIAVLQQQDGDTTINGDDENDILPMNIGPDLAPILQHRRGDASSNIVVGVYHELDLAAAEESLLRAGLQVDTFRDTMPSFHDKESNDSAALICLDNPRKTLRDLLQAAPEQSTLRVMESYWCTLQPLTPLFGDSIPRQQPPPPGMSPDSKAMTGIGNCLEPNRQLQLCLCEWPNHCHPNDMAAATMNPWTTTWSQEDFLAAATYMDAASLILDDTHILQ